MRGLSHGGIDSQPHRPRDQHVDIIQLEGHAQRCTYILAHKDQLVVIAGILDDHGEFVPSKSRDMHCFFCEGPKALADLIEKFVTDIMTMQIVDRFKPVQIDNPDGQTLVAVAGILEGRLQRSEELTPVCQTSQTVQIGDVQIGSC